ncbi:DUF4352 domain-containing protein [Streptomyces sp. SID14515]|uniref:DUF4352 domain-containing protein n=1 Tax=Streptomyces sp. SID14515 TaxID=2706074 RepID=UPI0013C921FC|nr:DUF4352 domain-containing protein [Streptomyces sp. SID14515]NEB41448.1 DUF4352 domain-containing protein [Streptomyces sp. SID14515]
MRAATALLPAVSATLLAGCGDSDSRTDGKASNTPRPSPSTESTPASPTQPTALAIGEPYRWTHPATPENVATSGISTVIGYEQPVSVRNWPADATDAENPEWIAVEVKVCNDNGDDITVFQTPWSLGFRDDTRVETRGLIGSGLPKPEYPVDGGTLRPGDCLRGKIPFVVEKGQRPDRIIYQGGEIGPVEWAVPAS